uniref:Dof zinc finger protein n=1 Tax=Anthurium amnicola TaxID=1678845 RepID=A0A1D1Z161_9ARAE
MKESDFQQHPWIPPPTCAPQEHLLPVKGEIFDPALLRRDPLRPSPMVRKGSKPQPPEALLCPRCDSPDTRFSCYNGRGGTKPKHYCNACRRYWIRGGTLRHSKRVLKAKPPSSPGGPLCPSGCPAHAVEGPPAALPEDPRAPHAAAAAVSFVGLSQRWASDGCPPSSAAMGMPHSECPRCVCSGMRSSCSACSAIWTPGGTASLSLLGSGDGRQWVPPATHQASAAAVSTLAASSVAVPVTASFPVEPLYEGDGLGGPLESGFLDWVDHFLQTQMNEEFRAAFLGGSEETGGCARPPPPSDQDQEPEHKLQQQQSLERRPPLHSSEHRGLHNGSQGPK